MACSRWSTPTTEHTEASGLRGAGDLRRTDADFEHNTTHNWNHGLGEIVTALLDSGLRVTRSRRARQRAVGRRCPARWKRCPNGEYRIAERPSRLPHSYTLQAVKGR